MLSSDPEKTLMQELSSLERKILCLLHVVCLPLSPNEVSRLLSIPPSRAQRNLSHLQARGHLVAVIRGRYYAAGLRPAVFRNLLVSFEYQFLGLDVIAVGGTFVHYIPRSWEHRFVHFAVSTLPDADLGLFLRPHRMIRAGTILCEYEGRRLKAGVTPGSSEHAVRLWDGTIIDGCNADESPTSRGDGRKGRAAGGGGTGDVLSWAPLINDAGPRLVNARLQEFDELPGRVFIVTLRDVKDGEEIFVLYGESYWAAGSTTKRHSTSKHTRSGNTSAVCERCGCSFPRRVMSLHEAACSDPLTFTVPECLDPLPHTALTSAAAAMGTDTSEKCAQISRHFTSGSNHSFSLTHEIVD